MKYLFLFALFLTTSQAFSQLGFCEGGKGEPIFYENFDGGGPLPPGTTSYTFVDGHDPYDGGYTISDEIGEEIRWLVYLPAKHHNLEWKCPYRKCRLYYRPVL